MVPTSFRAGTTATTRGHSGGGVSLEESSNARSCQKPPRKNASTIHTSREILARITGNKGTLYCVANPLAQLGQVCRLNGQAANSLARKRVHCIANRRSHHRQSRLTDTRWLFGTLHYVDLRFRCLRDPRHIVIIEVCLFHPAAFNGNGIVQRGGEPIDCCALNLRAYSARIHRPATIDGVHNPLHLDSPVFNAALRHTSRKSFEGIVSGN